MSDPSPGHSTIARDAFFGIEHLPLLTAAEMRAWDRRAIDEQGIPERVLMEAAGRASARIVQQLYPDGTVVGAVGAGNNGGDALVVLRTLQAWGREVCAVSVGDGAMRPYLLHGHALPTATGDGADAAFCSAGVIVDGLLGTGARGAPRAPQARIIEAITRARRPTVALDGPSGIDLTDGSATGVAIRADLTITFGAPKRGLLRFPGRAHAGRIIAVEVGFPPLGEAGAWLVTPGWARAHLPSIPANAHKGTLGTVAVLAGHEGMAGAAVLVATGAARAGAGMVRFVSPAANRVVLQTSLPEALFTDREGDGAADALADADVVVAGPALGKDDAALAALRTALERGSRPLLLDADALTLVAEDPGLLAPAAERPLLMTPHPGEMARLMECDIGEVLADPFGLAARAAERFGCAVLLKGSPSMVAASGEPTLVNVTGHSGIATGGMGDTLAGIAGALLAQGAAPQRAGALALFFSGRAAEIAGRGRSLLPLDVAEALPAAFAAPLVAAPIPGLLLDLRPAY